MTNANIKIWHLFCQFLEAIRAKQFDSQTGVLQVCFKNEIEDSAMFMKSLLGAVLKQFLRLLNTPFWVRGKD